MVSVICGNYCFQLEYEGCEIARMIREGKMVYVKEEDLKKDCKGYASPFECSWYKAKYVTVMFRRHDK